MRGSLERPYKFTQPCSSLEIECNYYERLSPKIIFFNNGLNLQKNLIQCTKSYFLFWSFEVGVWQFKTVFFENNNHLDLEYIESKTINNTIEDEMTSDEIDLEEEVILVYQLRPTSLRYSWYLIQLSVFSSTASY